MRSHRFKPIEELFFPYLERERDKIVRDFNDVTCNVYVFFPPEEEPLYGYFSISLECILDKADSDKADLVSLGISVDDHDNKYLINASVAWGNPYSRTVDRVFEESVDVTDENLSTIKKRLPRLISSLQKEIRNNPKGRADVN